MLQSTRGCQKGPQVTSFDYGAPEWVPTSVSDVLDKSIFSEA